MGRVVSMRLPAISMQPLLSLRLSICFQRTPTWRIHQFWGHQSICYHVRPGASFGLCA